MEFNEKLLRFLTENIEPGPINVAGPMGSGRSTFLRELSAMSCEKSIPHVLVDAGRYDSTTDPFLVLFSMLIKQFEALGLISNKNSRADLFKRAGVYFAKRAVPVAVRIGSLGILSGEELGGLDKVVDSELSKVAGKIAEDSMEQIEQKALAEQGFKDLLAENLAKMRAQAEQGYDRIIVMIDGLDGLLPERALAFLEVINGAMRVDGLVFVLSFDRAVLDAFGDKVYGVLPEGLKVSDRMVDMTIVLPQPGAPHMAHELVSSSHIFSADESSRNDVERVFGTCSQIWNVGVADQKKLIRQLHTILGFMIEDDQKQYARPITALLFLRRFEPDFYARFISEVLSPDLLFSMICPTMGDVNTVWAPPGVYVPSAQATGLMFRNDEIAAILVSLQMETNRILELAIDDAKLQRHRQYRYLDEYDQRHVSNMAGWSKAYLDKFSLDPLFDHTGYTIRAYLDQKMQLN